MIPSAGKFPLTYLIQVITFETHHAHLSLKKKQQKKQQHQQQNKLM